MEEYLHGLKGGRGDPPRGLGSRGDPPIRGIVWGDPLMKLETRGPAMGFSRGALPPEVKKDRGSSFTWAYPDPCGGNLGNIAGRFGKIRVIRFNPWNWYFNEKMGRGEDGKGRRGENGKMRE